jgi:cyanophycinase
MIPKLMLMTVLGLTSGDAEPKGHLVIVGGGPSSEVIQRRALELAGGAEARVLIIPFASRSPDAGERTASLWRSFGAEQVEVLGADDPEAAEEQVARADLIWMRGGSQNRLMEALLERPGLIESIRARYVDGATVGGTSAGAAVMSRLMIAGWDGRRDDDRPRCSDGLGLWPDVIVDQHFIRRNRRVRLEAAVRENPALLGVGIDESTAVIVHGREFEVLGNSEVLVFDARKVSAPAASDMPMEGAASGVVPLATCTLKPGMRYHLDRGVLTEQPSE